MVNHAWIRYLQQSVDVLDLGSAVGDRRRALASDGCETLVRHGTVMGIVWAVDDHPSLAYESSDSLVSILKSAGPSRFLPWAVVDAVVKHTTCDAVRDHLRRELPAAVAHALPAVLESLTGHPRAGGPPHQSLALLVIDLLRSWYAVPMLRDVLNSSRGGIMWYAAHQPPPPKRSRAEQSAAATDAVESPLLLKTDPWVALREDGGAQQLFDSAVWQEKKAAVAKILKALGSQKRSSGLAGAAVSKGKEVLSGSRAVAVSVEAMRRAVSSGHACAICGTYFDDPEARLAHSRMHFTLRGEQKMGLVRLGNLSLTDMVRYDCNHSDGSYLPTVGAPNAASAKNRLLRIKSIVSS